MQASPAPRRKLPTGALTASLGLHVFVFAALLLMPAIAVNEAPLEEAIAVEVVRSEPIEPVLQPPTQKPPDMPGDLPKPDLPSPDVPPPAPPETAPPAPAPSGMIHAKRLLSASVLNDARSREARQSLARLDDGERIEQLCGLEAMGQIHAWNAAFEPDRVVAYGMAEAKLSGHTLRADGAVFRSRQHWYRLTFICEMARDHKTVAAFAFEVGDAVPRREWAMRNLPAIH